MILFPVGVLITRQKQASRCDVKFYCMSMGRRRGIVDMASLVARFEVSVGRNFSHVCER